MKKLNKAIKVVALAISPLLLSFAILFVLVLFLKTPLSPYLLGLNLFLYEDSSSLPTATEKDYFEDIFVGYEEPETIDPEVDPNLIDGNDIVYPRRGARYARLSIASLELEADIYYDDSDAALSRGGVGQSYSTRIPGYGTPILIGGHNNSHFHALQHLKVGDIITITTNYGIFEYQVRECVIKRADDPTVLDLKKQEEELILYTCYPFTMLGLTRERYFVYADKISGPTVLH